MKVIVTLREEHAGDPDVAARVAELLDEPSLVMAEHGLIVGLADGLVVERIRAMPEVQSVGDNERRFIAHEEKPTETCYLKGLDDDER